MAETNLMDRVLAAEGAAQDELSCVPDWLWDGKSLPVPIEAIADSHYGLLVEERENLAHFVDLADQAHLSGLLLPDAKEVWVNAGEAPVRRRFTVAHELGHWVLHSNLGRKAPVIHCRVSEVREEAGEPATQEAAEGERYLAYPPLELDANQFAAALLMPRHFLRAHGEPAGDDAAALCALFGVSEEAMRRRLWYLQRVASTDP